MAAMLNLWLLSVILEPIDYFTELNNVQKPGNRTQDHPNSLMLKDFMNFAKFAPDYQINGSHFEFLSICLPFWFLIFI